jgi:transcriptional regulator with XRE-family HTH domain
MKPRRSTCGPLRHSPAALLAARLAAGLTLEQVAARAGISAGYVSELEGGTRTPSHATLVRIADAIGCPARQITSDGKPPVPSPEVWSRARAKAAAQGRTLAEVLEDLLRRYLDGG